jgi:manganese/iron transport system permease protein
MVSFLLDPLRPEFMQRAMLEAMILGVFGGVLGVYVVLRRLAFISDVLTHTIFPGIAIAFFLDLSLYLGAFVAGALSAVLLTLLTRNKRVTSDAALAVLLTAFFSVGVLVVSRGRSYSADLTTLLFGRILTVSWTDVAESAATMVVVLAVLAAIHKELILRAFDGEAARAMGFRVGALDLVLNLLITLFVVASVKAVGTVLVIALLVTPAATAQLLARTVRGQMVVAVLVGVVGGWLGLTVSYEASLDHGIRLASGSTIVLTVSLLFLIGLAVARVLSVRAHRRGRVAEPESLGVVNP